jgi:lipopolysaccharide biosynthesis glycosyltransferase
MLNFLYAFDRNYNTQAFVSIYSVLQNITEKINLYLILDETNENLNIPKKIINHKNINLIIEKVININENLYNLDDAHVSRATFYRLFLSDLYDDDLDFVYLDSDIICVNDPSQIIKSQFSEIKKNNNFIGFADELYRHQYEEPFKRLNMSGNKYFNAGVMLVNLMNWNKNNLTEKSKLYIKELQNKAKYWDQDILNSLIDGNYLSLLPELNYRTSTIDRKTEIDSLIFIHYSGKSKPWDVGGILEEFSVEYQSCFEELFGNNYHLVSKNRKNGITRLLNNIYALYRFKDLSFFKYVYQSLVAILKK